MSPEEALAVVREITLRGQRQADLETLLTSEQGFGLVTATPLQRAICRIAEGLPLGELAKHPHVIEAIGANIPEVQPDEVSLLSGTRTSKSMLAGAMAMRAVHKCSTKQLAPGEIPRYSIVSLRKDNADVIFGHIKGTVLARPGLRSLLMQDPTSDTIMLRSPEGRPCEIKVVAGAASGATLVSRWSIGVAFDEWPRMVGVGEGAINYDDMRAAVLSRLLPGAQVLNIGSPWAPFGPAYEQRKEHFGRPSKTHVYIHAAPADRMNPVWWTPERAEKLRAQDADAHRTDFEVGFLEPGELLYPASLLEQARREETIIGPKQGHTYVAAMDPATRSNAWTLVVGTRNHNVRSVVMAVQWQPKPGEPLKAAKVFAEMALVLKPYKVTTVKSDQWSFDVLREQAEAAGITLLLQTIDDAYDRYGKVLSWLERGWLELVNDPQLIDDLKRVQKKPSAKRIEIVLPKQQNGRHCDYAPAIVRVATSLYEDYSEPLPQQGTAEYSDRVARQIEDDEEREYREQRAHKKNARRNSPWLVGK